MPSSRGYFQPRDQTPVSCFQVDSLPSKPRGKPLSLKGGMEMSCKVDFVLGGLECRAFRGQGEIGVGSVEHKQVKSKTGEGTLAACCKKTGPR